ncbi:hypothetical protein [Streptomyces sp. HUAS TT7]
MSKPSTSMLATIAPSAHQRRASGAGATVSAAAPVRGVGGVVVMVGPRG